MKGLYFYKLQSPYNEDVTKDCKLTINEIDHNFVTLKDADIKEILFDEESNVVSLVRNNDEELKLDLSTMIEGITTNLEVDYDSVDGIITITHNGKTVTIDRLITEDNLHSKALTEVIADSTLSGLGTNGRPLGVAAVEHTGHFAPAISFIDFTKGEFMPNHEHLKKGDRYVTYEKVSDFGYLYDYDAVKKIDADLKHGWRVPTKEDWDNMLNAIEPCDKFRNHDSVLSNNMLGKVAGKLLKSKHFWKHSDDSMIVNFELGVEEHDEILNIEENSPRTNPREKRIKTDGTDAFGMGIVPGGFSDGCEIVDYFGKRGIYWTNTTINETDVYVKRFDFNKAGVIQNVESPHNLFSIKLVKDYDGSNHKPIEFINGMNYTTALIPTLNTKYGFSIWTTINVAFSDEKYHPEEPNYGEHLSYRKVYCINEWNGFEWEKKQMKEGESIVLLSGLDGEHNISYRIMNGVLYSEATTIYDEVMEKTQLEIDKINSEVNLLQQITGDGFFNEEGDYTTLTERIKNVESTIGEGFFDSEGNKITITDSLRQEIENRTIADQQLREDLDKEISERIEANEKNKLVFEEETRLREEADTLLQEEIDRIEAAVGLDEEGEYILTEGYFTNEATSIVSAIDFLDTSLKTEEELRFAQDGVIKSSIGLAEDGSYIKRENSNYINATETVVDSIDELDKALKDEEVARFAQDGVIKSSIGLAEDGSYIKRENSNYINATETVVDSIDELDKALKDEEVARIVMDNYLHSRLIKASEHPNIAFDCANGVLTLYTEDPTNNIIVKLNGDYGIFPYEPEKY